ncbi:MAG TPA: DUF192 domain-containing protein, partial [Candidatus Synoicihabitans sp.]|nr:DUF192 domain-containing protein [Candidatus Synoicihabitans sp.]
MKNANPVSLTLRTLLVLCWGLIAAGCGGGDEPAATPKPAEHYFPIEVGGRTVELQLAIAPAELERGLMFRRDLKSNQGMLFLFSQPQQMGFWMRNTPTPLDIGF